MIVGERIRVLRKEKGLTQKQLGDALNLDKTTISHYENDQRMPDLEFLVNLSSYLDEDINRLLGTEHVIRHETRVEKVSLEEINCILELRKTRNYKKIISDPKRYARLVDKCFPSSDKYTVNTK